MGRPVLPLVKKMTCGSRSSSPGASTSAAGAGAAARSSSAWETRSKPRPSIWPACSSSASSSRGRAYPTTVAASSAPRRAFTGANTAPSFASAKKIVSASSEVSPHHATRSPCPTPMPASACPARLARSSSSANVTEPPESCVAATRRGVERAACRSTFPISSATTGHLDGADACVTTTASGRQYDGHVRESVSPDRGRDRPGGGPAGPPRAPPGRRRAHLRRVRRPGPARQPRARGARCPPRRPGLGDGPQLDRVLRGAARHRPPRRHRRARQRPLQGGRGRLARRRTRARPR